MLLQKPAETLTTAHKLASLFGETFATPLEIITVDTTDEPGWVWLEYCLPGIAPGCRLSSNLPGACHHKSARLAPTELVEVSL